MKIRKAIPADAGILATLINELAEYEHLADESNPNPQDLADHLAEDASPRIEAFLAEMEGQPVGFALCFPCYSTFLSGWGLYLEDLFVRPENRKQGIGLALLRRVAAETVRRGGQRLEWNVLTWNRLALDFYEAFGAEPRTDWQMMRLTGAPLRRLAEAT